MKSDSQDQCLLEDTLFFLYSKIRFSGPQQAVTDIKYLMGEGCYGQLQHGVYSVLEAVLLSLKQSNQVIQISCDQLIHYYHSAHCSETARRQGWADEALLFSVANKLTPPIHHIPYLLEATVSSPSKLPYRFGVARQVGRTQGEESEFLVDVGVQYYSSNTASRAGFHTVWIVLENSSGLCAQPDQWSAIISPDGAPSVATLLHKQNDQATTPVNITPPYPLRFKQRLSAKCQRSQLTTLLSNHQAIKLSDNDSGGGQPGEPVRIQGAPPFETKLPIDYLSDCTMEELIYYYPEHVIHWPGLAILYNHYRLRLSNEVFVAENTIRFIKTTRGNSEGINSKLLLRSVRYAGRQLLENYGTNFHAHMKALKEAIHKDEENATLDPYLNSILWLPPKDIILQDPVPLADVAAIIDTTLNGQFSSRVLAAMRGEQYYLPQSNQLPLHPLISRCSHKSAEVKPFDLTNDTLAADYYPVYLDYDQVLASYLQSLRNEPLLYILLKYASSDIAKFDLSLPPDDGSPMYKAVYETVYGAWRKRQQMAIDNRAKLEGRLKDWMSKVERAAVHEEVLNEFHDEVRRAGYREPRKGRGGNARSRGDLGRAGNPIRSGKPGRGKFFRRVRNAERDERTVRCVKGNGSGRGGVVKERNTKKQARRIEQGLVQPYQASAAHEPTVAKAFHSNSNLWEMPTTQQVPRFVPPYAVQNSASNGPLSDGSGHNIFLGNETAYRLKNKPLNCATLVLRNGNFQSQNVFNEEDFNAFFNAPTPTQDFLNTIPGRSSLTQPTSPASTLHNENDHNFLQHPWSISTNFIGTGSNGENLATAMDFSSTSEPTLNKDGFSGRDTTPTNYISFDLSPEERMMTSSGKSAYGSFTPRFPGYNVPMSFTGMNVSSTGSEMMPYGQSAHDSTSDLLGDNDDYLNFDEDVCNFESFDGNTQVMLAGLEPDLAMRTTRSLWTDASFVVTDGISPSNRCVFDSLCSNDTTSTHLGDSDLIPNEPSQQVVQDSLSNQCFFSDSSATGFVGLDPSRNEHTTAQPTQNMRNLFSNYQTFINPTPTDPTALHRNSKPSIDPVAEWKASEGFSLDTLIDRHHNGEVQNSSTPPSLPTEFSELEMTIESPAMTEREFVKSVMLM